MAGVGDPPRPYQARGSQVCVSTHEADRIAARPRGSHDRRLSVKQAFRTPSPAGRVAPAGPRKSMAAGQFSHVALVAVFLVLSGTRSAHGAEYTFSWSHPRPQGNALNGVAFEDASLGYAVGDRGVVLRTTDGGANWTLVDLFPEFSTDLEDLVVLGPGDLLAVGAPPGIFHSTDAGATWAAVTNPSTGRLIDVELVTGTTFSAVGDNGQVL